MGYTTKDSEFTPKSFTYWGLCVKKDSNHVRNGSNGIKSTEYIITESNITCVSRPFRMIN